MGARSPSKFILMASYDVLHAKSSDLYSAIRLAEPRRPGLPALARSHSAVRVRPLVMMFGASHWRETEPSVPQVASPSSHGKSG